MSGTELRTLAETTAPQIPGYSVIGEIVEVGEKVKGYRPGDLISTGCPKGARIKPGDSVRARIEGVGALSATVHAGGRQPVGFTA